MRMIHDYSPNERTSPKRYTHGIRKARSKIKIRHLQSTVRAWNFGGDHVNRAAPGFATVQRFECRRSQVETMAGSVDRGHIDRRAVRRVTTSDAPAPAAVGRVPCDVESAAGVRVVGNLVERRVFGGEAVGPVRARDVVERVSGVVERAVERST